MPILTQTRQVEYDITSQDQAEWYSADSLDRLAVQVSWIKAPGSGNAQVSVEISIDGEGWVKAPDTAGATKAALVLAFSGTTLIGRNYDISRAKKFRVTCQGTGSGGRVRVTWCAQSLPAGGANVTRDVYEDKYAVIDENAAITVPARGQAEAMLQLTAASGFSGTMTVLPEMTIDGEGWETAYRVGNVNATTATDETLTGTPSTLVAGPYQIDCLSQFRIRVTNAPSGQARMAVLIAAKE